MKVKQYATTIPALLVSIVIAVGGYWTWRNYTYHDTKQPQQILQQQQKTQDDVVLIFHKTGCPDCQQVVRQVNQAVQAGQADHYVMVDTKDSNLYQKYNVIEVPTAIHLKAGQEVARYAGANNPDRLVNVIKATKE